MFLLVVRVLLLGCLTAEDECGCLWPGDVWVLLLAELNSLLSLLLAVVVDCLIGCCCCWDERGCLRPGDVLALQLVRLSPVVLVELESGLPLVLLAS